MIRNIKIQNIFYFIKFQVLYNLINVFIIKSEDPNCLSVFFKKIKFNWSN
jgi:hypothetical protein